MARKTKNKQSKKRSSGKSQSVNMQSILINGGLAIGAFLVTNYGSKLIKGNDTLIDAGYKVLLPQVAGVVSPLVMKKNAKILVPVAIGSIISLFLGLIETVPKDPEKKAKLTSMALITGEDYMDDDSEVIDLRDLNPEQQELLGKYIMTGNNSDPLAGQEYVMTGDNSDPLA